MTRLAFRAFAWAGAAALLAAPGAAQGRHIFALNQSQSSFSFSGTITYPPITGNIVGQPSTFNVSGRQEANLTVAGGQLSTGQLVDSGRFAVTVPTLNAIVPNIFPFLPPLATITVTGATAVFTSVNPTTLAPTTFSIAANGSFTTSVVANLLSGNAAITVLGNPQNVALAGLQSSPQQVSGTINPLTGGVRLTSGINTTFVFDEPSIGASGTLTLNGQIVGNDLDFNTNRDTLSLSAGGSQNFRLSAGTAHAGRVYLVLGNFTGTSPGINLGAVTLPLNPDSYLITTAVSPNVAPLINTASTLNALGIGDAAFTIPPLNIPALIGIPFHHAYIAIQGQNVVLASNAMPLGFTN